MVHEKTTLSSIRVRFIALCDSEDDGVIFVSMKFDPFDTTIDENSEYIRPGDCLPCHQSLDTDEMGYIDYLDVLKME
mgnify:CR=1 FL=1